jgi:glycosyl transferase family 25
MPESDKPGFGVNGYIINLESAANRRDHMQQVAGCFDIPLQFFSALTPDNLPKRWRDHFYDHNGKPWADLKPGEIACYASHLELMSRAVSENVPVLIAEDDLRPLVKQINITELLQRLPDDWGFLRLSGNMKSPAQVRGVPGEPVIVEMSRQPNNMGLYLVSPQGARQFIEYSTKRFRAIDEDLRRTWEHGAVNYCTASKLVEINIFDSNIDAAGDRGDLPERKRARSVGPSAAAELVKKIRWNLTRFGFKDSMRMLLNMFANKLRKKPNRRWLLD